MFEPAKIRRDILQMAFSGQSVHVACAFSLVEIFSVLYQKILRFNQKDPSDPTRDYLMLSKGHGVMALYSCLKQLGWIEPHELDTYFKDGTRLRGLGELGIPGLEVNGGSLGHGLPVACGVALGMKRLGSSQNVFVVVGDGEMNEGSMWESLLFAAHHQLSNLTIIVDENRLQAMGTTDEVLKLGSLKEKFQSFGFAAETCDGHDSAALYKCLSDFGALQDNRPKAVVARTIKGYGVSFMENDNVWHYSRLSPEVFKKALNEVGEQ